MLAQGSGEANDAKEYKGYEEREEREEPGVMRTGQVICRIYGNRVQLAITRGAGIPAGVHRWDFPAAASSEFVMP